MEISKATVGVLAVFCLAVGAGGAYLAIRGNEPAPATTGTEAPVSPGSFSVGLRRIGGDPRRNPRSPRTPRSLSADPPSPLRRNLAPRRRARACRARPRPRAYLPNQHQNSTHCRCRRCAWRCRSVAPPVVEPVRPPEPELIRALEPPSPEFEELVVSADSVVGLQMETSITSEGARVEDQVVARVSRDCVVDGRVVIPAGAEGAR